MQISPSLPDFKKGRHNLQPKPRRIDTSTDGKKDDVESPWENSKKSLNSPPDAVHGLGKVLRYVPPGGVELIWRFP